MAFQLLQRDPQSQARRGRLTLPHGTVETPIFMPVGTQGTVKTLHPDDLETLGAQIILGNTYHLAIRPGADAMRQLGGLHQFSTWNRPILTDSGGFQVWSLAKLRKITEEGVRFQNHLDGATMMLSPEKSMEIQAALGSDIAMIFDECPPYPCDYRYAEKSLGLTSRWAKRCKDWISQNNPTSGNGRQHHFGIVQGSIYADLRERSAKELVELDFDGYAIGGVSVGEPEHEMLRAIENAAPFLPEEKPRYAMGLGTPPQMLEMISRGIDMFDCVMPTRLARHGVVLTPDGPLHIKNKRYEFDLAPLDACGHPTITRFSRAYVRHLFKAKEMLALRIMSFQNLEFYLRLMQQVRDALDCGNFSTFKDEFISRYNANKL